MNMLSLFPKSAQVIAEVIGAQATLALSERCYSRASYYRHTGCLNLSIPKTIPRDHWIMETLGRTKAMKLSETFGGEKIPLAKCTAIQRGKRNDEIRSLSASGKTITEIADQFQITTKAVMIIVDPIMAERHRARSREHARVVRQRRRLLAGTAATPGVIGTSEADMRKAGRAADIL